jgi:hypothetical protein
MALGIMSLVITLALITSLDHLSLHLLNEVSLNVFPLDLVVRIQPTMVIRMDSRLAGPNVSNFASNKHKTGAIMTRKLTEIRDCWFYLLPRRIGSTTLVHSQITRVSRRTASVPITGSKPTTVAATTERMSTMNTQLARRNWNSLNMERNHQVMMIRSIKINWTKMNRLKPTLQGQYNAVIVSKTSHLVMHFMLIFLTAGMWVPSMWIL